MRSRRLTRCAGCGLNAPLCVCALLPRLLPRTRVKIVAHRTELVKTTNTAKLVVSMLQGASLRARGDIDEPSPEPAPPGSFLLYPSAEAIPLSSAIERGLTTLIVPDGTWTQTKRIARRDPICRGLVPIRLEAMPASAYRLRRNLREDGLCTLEAIAEALRLIEGDAIADAMLGLFHVWVERSERLRAGDHEVL